MTHLTLVRGASARVLLLMLVSLWTLLAAPHVAAAEDAPRILDASAQVSAQNALVVELRVRTDVPAGLVITYGNGDAGTFRVARPANGTTEQTVRIVRLRAETDYGLVVYAVTGDQWSAPWVHDVRTGPLPEVLQQWRFQVTGTPTFGLTFSDFQAGGHTGLVALDETGAVVWYYHLPGGNKILGHRRLPSGDTAAIIQGIGAVRISLAGAMTAIIEDHKGETYTHHDLELLPNGRVLALTDLSRRMDLSRLGRGADKEVAISAIRELDLDTGAASTVWTTDGLVDPLTEVHLPSLQPLQGSQIDPALDWLHLNSITRGPRGNYLLSSPSLDTVYSLSADMRTIEWRLGGPKSDFALAPNDRFYFQHSAHELPNGNVLLFDNGGARWTSHQRPEAEGGVYSRAVEYALDRATGTARKVWEYRSTPDLSSPIISSVDRLPSGNTLVNFGVAPLSLVEADAGGRVVWRLDYTAPATFAPPVDLGAFSLRFQARGIEALNGEMRIAAGVR